MLQIITITLEAPSAHENKVPTEASQHATWCLQEIATCNLSIMIMSLPVGTDLDYMQHLL
jgi:hypothetical protein